MTPLVLLRAHPLFHEVDSARLAALARQAEVIHLDDHEILVRPGALFRGVFVLVRGALQLSRRDRSGKSQALLGTMQAPGVIGDAELHAGEPRWGITLRAAGKLIVVRVPGAPFVALVSQDPRLSYALYRDSAIRLWASVQTWEIFALQRVRRQILRLLWNTSELSDRGEVRSAPLSPLGLARALGINEKTVARNLSALQKDGQIRKERNRAILLVTEEEALDGLPRMPAHACGWRFPTDAS